VGFDVFGDAFRNMAGDVVSNVADRGVNAGSADSEDRVIVDIDTGSEGLEPGAATELASGLIEDFESRCHEWRIGLELLASFVFSPSWAANLASDFEDVADGPDWLRAGSGVDAESDDASAALKVEGAGGDEGLVVVGAAGVPAGIGIAFTYIGVPRDRMHFMRQQWGADLGWESRRRRVRFQRLTKVGPALQEKADK
jgi:hypothetical protein